MSYMGSTQNIASMKTIGMIGGSSDVSTAEYYRLINAGIKKNLGGHYTAEIIINSMNFAKSNYFLDKGDIEEGGRYIGEKAVGLEKAGAEFIILACNTWHCAVDIFMQNVNIPLLHIADPTAEAISADGINTVALFGTKATMELNFLKSRFEDRYNLKILTPERNDRDYIDRVIFEELTRGVFDKNSKKKYISIMNSLREKGAQGLILGCTEITLLLSQNDLIDFPIYDTTHLHVKAAVNLSLGQ